MVSQNSRNARTWSFLSEFKSEKDVAVKSHHALTLQDLALLFGVELSDFEESDRHFFDSCDFSYRHLTEKEREEFLFSALVLVFSGQLSRSGPSKKAVWEDGWRENLTDLIEGVPSKTALIPKFVRTLVPKRLNGRLVFPSAEDFETNLARLMFRVIFRKQFLNVDRVFEFGCGTSQNLVLLSSIFPEMELHGLDWVQSSLDIINKINTEDEKFFVPHLFDCFNPDYSVDLRSGDGVFTVGTLEQLGTNFEDFISFLVEKSPSVCVHFETMNEIYVNQTVEDFLAIEYSKARNYLWNFISHLEDLESAGKLEILEIQRTFGSQFHEGYSYAIWRPI